MFRESVRTTSWCYEKFKAHYNPKKSAKKSPKKTPKKNKLRIKMTRWLTIRLLSDLSGRMSQWKQFMIRLRKKYELKALPFLPWSTKSNLIQFCVRRAIDKCTTGYDWNCAKKTNMPAASRSELHYLGRLKLLNPVSWMFEKTRNQSFDIMPPTDTTEKSKGVFSAEETKVLVDLRKDMIKGAHISKPLITTRQQGGSMTKVLLKTAL